MRTPARSRVVAVTLVAPLALALAAVAPRSADAAADLCAAGYASDFNGDGRADAVVADPSATVNGQAQAGRVVVLYGDADGLVGEGARAVVHQGSGAVAGIAEAGDRFGFSVAAADLDCDDHTDLVVGSPYEDLGAAVDAGYVQVVWGAAAGLGTGKASTQFTQTTFARPIAGGDQFGYAVDALEDVGQGGTPAPDAYALAIGAPGTDVGGHNDAGWVGFRMAYDGGSELNQVTQDSPGIPGGAEAGDRFGAAVSLNYLVGMATTVDAVVGAPGEDVGAVADAGAITVVRDVYFEPDGIAYDQSSAGVPGTAEAGDRFGRTVDTLRVGGTTRVAVGVPGEDIGSAADAGSVQLFNATGTTITPGADLTQDTAGVADSAESGDQFGDRLAFAPPGLGDGTTRLAVAAPGENGAAVDSGMVQVFPVNDLDGETSWTQGSPGVPGAVSAGDRFGSALAVVAGPTERALIVGVADDVDHPAGMVNVIPFGAGAPRAWVPGVGGVPLAGASRFGDALASAGHPGGA